MYASIWYNEFVLRLNFALRVFDVYNQVLLSIALTQAK